MVIDWLILDTTDRRKKNPAVASQRSLSDLEERSQETQNAQKNQRKIEMGWMHFREGAFVQVHAKKGVRTRKDNVLKDSKKTQLD